jgi:ATP-dependent RNA helicase DeaD
MKQLSFLDLGISKETLDVLNKKGYQRPTEIQSALIPEFLTSSDDIMAKADTGTGKTGAFGIPLIEKMIISQHVVQAMVIAPTRELASQVAKEINDFKGGRAIQIIELCGGQGMAQQIEQLKKIKMASIVVGTPGRLLDHLSKKRLNLSRLSVLVIDEVDEMLNFGFKEDIDKIVSKANPEKRTIILSATLPKFVLNVAKTYLNQPKEIDCAKESSEKPNIEQLYFKINKGNKVKLLTRVMDGLFDFYGFIFCNTKREADQLSEKLIQLGYSAESMHGDLSQGQRNRALSRFKTRQCDILVVTDVAARGIDVKNISHVINYSVPQNIEAYTHRIGRTGRAGQSGTAITFVKETEFFKFKRIIKLQKNGIQKKEIPSEKDAINLKKERLLTTLNTLPTTKPHIELAQDILKTAAPELVVARLLKLRFSDFFRA